MRDQIGPRQEYHTDGDQAVAYRLPSPLHMLAEKILRDPKMNTGTIACFAIRIDSAPVPDRLQRLDTCFHNITPQRPVNRGDEADAATLMLVRRIIGMGGLKPLRICFPVSHKGRAAGYWKSVILFHGDHRRFQEARSSAALACCSI